VAIEEEAMSIPVAVERLRSETVRFTFAPSLLTVSEDAHPHAVAVEVAWEGGTLAMQVGKRPQLERPLTGNPTLASERAGWLHVDRGRHGISDRRWSNRGDTEPCRVTPSRCRADVTKPGCSADCVPILG
jgi:hypothetical protein